MLAETQRQCCDCLVKFLTHILPAFLSRPQMLVSAVLIHGVWSAGWVAYRPFNLPTARAMLPLSLCYNANVAFALASLAGVNIPMYIALKRLTPLAVLVTGFFRGKAKPPLQVGGRGGSEDDEKIGLSV